MAARVSIASLHARNNNVFFDVKVHETMDVKQAKLNIIQTFYGIEYYIDLHKNVAESIQQIDESASEFETISQILDLDLWFIDVEHTKTGKHWNPFEQSLHSFTNDSEHIICTFYPNLQYNKNEIVKFIQKC